MPAVPESLPDVIHRSVHVAAPHDAVWSAVSRPAVWVEDVRELVVVERVEPDYVACRATPAVGAGTSHPETRIELFCSSSTDGTVRVRVAESGFGTMTDAQEATRAHAAQTMAWEEALDRLRRSLE